MNDIDPKLKKYYRNIGLKDNEIELIINSRKKMIKEIKARRK